MQTSDRVTTAVIDVTVRVCGPVFVLMAGIIVRSSKWMNNVGTTIPKQL